MLSHYTGIEGLKGIAQSQSLWACDFTTLNDGDEFLHGLKTITRASLKIVIANLPPEEVSKEDYEGNVETLVTRFAHSIRESILQSKGYNALYVTSFAKPKTEHEQKEGILTLWDRYTNTRGYCLQYSRKDIESIVTPEKVFYSYALIDVVEVKYFIDAEDIEFKLLVDQLARWILEAAAKSRNNYRLLENAPNPLPKITVVGKLLRFCAIHKNESFVDEREVRIIAIPTDITVPQPFRPTVPKKIDQKITGEKYIIFGSRKNPPLRPKRIIIGPNAELDEKEIEAIFPTTMHSFCPEIYRSTIPIRKRA